MEFREDVLDVRGCKVSLKRGGAGTPLLYLHGTNGVPAVQPFMTDLARDFDVLVPEHPGFGRSDEPDWLDNIHDLAYFYLDFLDQLNLANVLLVGGSIGGWLALEIAVRDTSRLAALSLVAPAGIYVPGLSRGDIFMWPAEQRVRNLYFDQSRADEALARDVSSADIDTEFKNQFTTARIAWEPRLFDPHLAKWLHRIDVPTQIVWGADDKILPAGYAAEFARQIPGATAHVIPQCGHLPQTEKTADFIRLVRDFAAGRAKIGKMPA